MKKIDKLFIRYLLDIAALFNRQGKKNLRSHIAHFITNYKKYKSISCIYTNPLPKNWFDWSRIDREFSHDEKYKKNTWWEVYFEFNRNYKIIRTWESTEQLLRELGYL